MKNSNPETRDYPAIGFLVGALLVLIVAGYFLVKNFDRRFLDKPGASITSWIKKIERSVNSLPGLKEILPVLKAKHHFQRGHKLYKKKRFQKAIDEFNRAIKLDPENVKAYFWRGRALIKTRQYHKAMIDFNRTVTLHPGYAEAHNNLAWLYGRRGKYDNSIKCLNKAIGIKPDSGWSYYYRGYIYLQKGDVTRALSDTKKACRLKNQKACQAYPQMKEKAHRSK